MNIKNLKSAVSRLHYYGFKYLNNWIFFSGKILGRFVFPIQIILKYNNYINHKSYYPELILKNKFQIFIEQLFYIFRTGETNNNYFIFGFDRKSKTDFKNYVPWLTFTHARNRLNQQPVKPEYDPYNYVCLLRDKFVFESFCRSVGVKTPQNIGMVNHSEFFVLNENKFSPLENMISFDMDVICKKNVSYGGGMNSDILKLSIEKKNIVLNNKRIDINTLKNTFGDDNWIIQKRITNQNPEFAQFHNNSINTIRVVTVKKDNNISILSSFFRIGVNGNHTDNWSSGGIVCGIDIDEGTLKKWGLLKPGIGTKCDRHPNTNIIFEGFKLPYWDEIIETVKKAHQLFYGLHSIGWDVAVTTDGVIIIEGNDNWGTTSAQLNGGLKNEFNKYFK